MFFENLCLQTTSVKEALKQLDQMAKKILFIVTEDNKLIGTVTDGDIRRWILNNRDINESITVIMNPKPVFLLEGNRHQAKKLMLERNITALPILNDNHVIIEILFSDDFFKHNISKRKNTLNATVVINAGGTGSRLSPITNVIPKPLIPIGEISIIERIMNNFSEYNCSNFTVIINYKKELIKAYFKELNSKYSIDFIEEPKPLGTIGSLSVITLESANPIFMSNCDILVEGDYLDMLNLHKKSKNMITIISSLKANRVPYGVINLNDLGEVCRIDEKPQFDFLVSTGLYIIEPEIISHIPKDTFFHATDLIAKCISDNKRVGIYPISEECWLDMGEFNEITKMYKKLGV